MRRSAFLVLEAWFWISILVPFFLFCFYDSCDSGFDCDSGELGSCQTASHGPVARCARCTPDGDSSSTPPKQNRRRERNHEQKQPQEAKEKKPEEEEEEGQKEGTHKNIFHLPWEQANISIHQTNQRTDHLRRSAERMGLKPTGSKPAARPGFGRAEVSACFPPRLVVFLFWCVCVCVLFSSLSHRLLCVVRMFLGVPWLLRSVFLVSCLGGFCRVPVGVCSTGRAWPRRAAGCLFFSHVVVGQNLRCQTWGWLPLHCCLFRRLSGCSPGYRPGIGPQALAKVSTD